MEKSKPTRAELLKAKYGEDYFSRLGSIGGRRTNPNKGFGCAKVGENGMTGRERAVKAGQTSRRTKKLKKEEENEINDRRAELQSS